MMTRRKLTIGFEQKLTRRTLCLGQNTNELKVTGVHLPFGESIADLAGNQARLSRAPANFGIKVHAEFTATTSVTVPRHSGYLDADKIMLALSGAVVAGDALGLSSEEWSFPNGPGPDGERPAGAEYRHEGRDGREAPVS